MSFSFADFGRYRTGANNLTAAGNSQATAAAVQAQLNVFTTVPAGTGCLLPHVNASNATEIQVLNRGTNALLVYPPPGGHIETQAANTPFSVAPGYSTLFQCFDSQMNPGQNWTALLEVGASASIPPSTIIATTAPTGVPLGSLWWNPADANGTGQLYVQTAANQWVTVPSGTFPAALTVGGPLTIGVPASAQISAGTDGAAIDQSNLEFSAATGVGFMNTAPAQNVPAGLNSAWCAVHGGTFSTMGNLNAFNAANTNVTQIQNLGFRRNGTDQQLWLDSNSIVATLTSATPVTGGSGVNVNDRFYDIYRNCYTALTTSAGACTSIRMDTASARITAPPANPVTLTPAPGFSGTGVTVNLTWTSPARFLINCTGATQTLALGATAGVSVLNPLSLISGLGAFGAAAVTTKPTVSGACAGNTAIKALLTALASYGFLTDSTTA